MTGIALRSMGQHRKEGDGELTKEAFLLDRIVASCTLALRMNPGNDAYISNVHSTCFIPIIMYIVLVAWCRPTLLCNH